MSWQHTSWAASAPCASAGEKAILLLIASYVGTDGTCYPGQKTIAQQACCSEKTVERALKAFEERGWIERKKRFRQNGSRTSDLIILKAVPAAEQFENAQADIMSDGGETTRHSVRDHPTPCPSPPDTMSPPTTFESPEESPEEEKARARGRASLPTQDECDAFFAAYPAGGLLSVGEGDLPIMLQPHAARVGGMGALIGAAGRYAAEVAKHQSKPMSLQRWLANRSLVDRYANAARPKAAAQTSALTWESHVAYFRRYGSWFGEGPAPDQPGCRAPPDILAKHGFNTERASA